MTHTLPLGNLFQDLVVEWGVAWAPGFPGTCLGAVTGVVGFGSGNHLPQAAGPGGNWDLVRLWRLAKKQYPLAMARYGKTWFEMRAWSWFAVDCRLFSQRSWHAIVATMKGDSLIDWSWNFFTANNIRTSKFTDQCVFCSRPARGWNSWSINCSGTNQLVCAVESKYSSSIQQHPANCREAASFKQMAT